MPIKLYIAGVDRSEYLKPSLSVSPGGDGVIGSATIHLDQQAGGLDLRPMMDVRIWETFNAAGAGIAAKGRLWGGLISKRATRNRGTTKFWDLPCADYNVILKKTYRRAAPVYAVSLAADTLDDQIADLFNVLQGTAPTIELDVISGIALTTAMPAVTYEGGHTWEWYLQQLLLTAHIEDPAVFPSYYMGVLNTFGVGESFGSPVLWVYDAASPPLSSVAFSDTPTGAEKSVFDYLTRDTDATALAQLQQSRWDTRIMTAVDNASQALYPNPYIDEVSGSGYWTDGALMNDTSSTTEDEAQAAVDRIILAKGAPRDSFKWVTYERLLPGEYVDLEWALEGIPPGTQMRVAAATFELEPPDVIKSTLTINTRRLGLFEDGLTGFFAPPIEGDTVPPLPPANVVVSTNVYNPIRRLSELSFTITASPSPDTAGYRMQGTVNGVPYDQDVEDDLTPTLLLFPNSTYSLRAVAYDRAGNVSDPFPAPADPALTGTTADVDFIVDPSLVVLSSGRDKSGYYILVEVDHASLSDTYGGWVRVQNGFDRLIPIAASLTEPLALPCRVYIPNVHPNVLYELSAQVVTEYGQESLFTDPTVSHTITYLPDPDPPIWDDESPDDPTLRGLEVVAGLSSEVGWDTSITHDSKTSLKLTNGVGGNTAVLTPPYPVFGGETLAIEVWRRRSTGTGTAPNTVVAIREYTLAAGMTETTLDTGIATTSFVDIDDRHTLLSTTRYVRLLLQQWDSGGGGSGYSSYFSNPRIKRVLTSKEVPVALTLDDQTVTLSGTGSLVAGGGKVTVDAGGIKLGGTDTGANNIDFYNEVGVQGGRMYGSGVANYFTMVLDAFYNGSGLTDMRVNGRDRLQLEAEAYLASIIMGIDGITHDSGATTRYHKFDTGSVVIGGALATNATDGFLYIPTCAGTPTGTPTTQTGTVPMVFDSTNDILYLYSKGVWLAI